MATWKTISFDCPPELLDRMESEIEDSHVHENRSQLVRSAIRKMLSDDDVEGEFEEAN